MTNFTLSMPEPQARNLHRVVASHMQALKNWAASRVESGDLAGAQALVAELREFEELYAATNIDAKYIIATATGKPVLTEIYVQNRSR